MAVSAYTPNNCKYKIGKLDNFVFFLDKDSLGKITIDDGEAYVNSASTALTFETISTALEENETLDERYEFTHSLSFVINGYSNINSLDNLYYVIFKDLNGNHWLLNPQLPCKVTHTYTINSKENTTKFVISTKSNFPLLQVKNFESVTTKACKEYYYCGIQNILLNETAFSKYENGNVIYTNDGFKQIDFLKDSAVFTETFDGTNVSHKLEFAIDFDNYKSSWHYNLLEFTRNTYALVLSTKCGQNVSCGFIHGLQPSFTIVGSDTSINTITITLADLHDDGFFINMPLVIPYVPSTEKKWVWTIDQYECISDTMAKRLLQQEQDDFGNNTGRYKCLEGYEARYEYLGDNLIGTFSDVETFNCDSCAGRACSLECSIPNTLTFNDVSCRNFSLKANSDWSISSDYNGITVSPSSGLADTLYTIQVCNSTEPTTSLSSHTLTIDYCNSTRTFNVNVVQASESECFPQGLTYNLSSESQVLTVPTNCCIKSVSSNSIYVQQFSIQNGYVTMQVYRNDSGSERTVQVTFTLCDDTTVTIYVVQQSFYSRWIKVGEECDGELLCDVEHMLSGTSADDISSPTLWMRYTNCVSSDTCVGDTYRWVQTTDTTCSDGKLYYIEYLQVYSGGTWVNEGSTRLGEETEDISGICNVNIEHWIVQPNEYLCDDTIKYEKKRLYLQTNEDQPQAEWIETDAYCMGNLIEMDSNDCGYSATTGYTYFLYRPDGEMCDGTSLYERDKLYVSNDEETWIPTDVYQMGALIQQNSESCGYVSYYEYQWVLTDLTVCEGFNKYYKYKEQKRPSGSSATWVDVVPSVYSTDGYGTQTKVLAESASTDCGYVPEIEPQYRWVNLNPSAQYYCSGTTKYYKQQRQISMDSGTTWTNMSPAEYRMGASAETNSSDCGGGFEPIYKWVNITPVSGDASTYICDECEEPPTPVFDGKFFATYNDSTTYSAACDSNTELTSATTKAHTTSYTAMTSAEIGSCVTTIDEKAFYRCYSLSSVTIPNSVTTIDNRAFQDCTSLTSVTIPNSITTFGDYVFYDCTSLTSVTISNGVTSIGNNAFRYCTSLETVTIPNSVTSIGYEAFDNCSGLTSVTIGSGVTSIGMGAFGSCASLTSIDIPSGVTTISDFAFFYCASLTSIGIPSGVTSIGESAFYNCSGLTSIDIPNSVTSIGNSAFQDCTSITSVTIPNSVTSIGTYAFHTCTSLTSVTIGNGVTSIGNYAFSTCTSLTSVTIEATTPPTLGTDAFSITFNCPIYVPSRSVETYKAASGWSDYASRIQAIPNS